MRRIYSERETVAKVRSRDRGVGGEGLIFGLIQAWLGGGVMKDKAGRDGNERNWWAVRVGKGGGQWQGRVAIHLD